jgi:hypothetical protein
MFPPLLFRETLSFIITSQVTINEPPLNILALGSQSEYVYHVKEGIYMFVLNASTPTHSHLATVISSWFNTERYWS